MSGSQWEGGGSHRAGIVEKKKKEKLSHKGINVTRDSSLMARKRSTCPWKDARVEGSPSFFHDPFRDRSSRRPASTGKPIFGAGRSTSLTDECQANIDSPRGNWGTRCARVCTRAFVQRPPGPTSPSMARLSSRPPFPLLRSLRVFLHINARRHDSFCCR